jgi:membrane protein required for beta-lactamase induction
VLAPGQQAAVALVLRAPERTVTERYMPAWIPWASLGVGAAVLGAGSWVNRRADDKAADFNQAFLDKCPRGCERVEAPELYTRLDDAQSERRNALRLYVTGAAAVTIGAALLYVNRERVVRLDGREGTLSVTPVLAPHAAGVSARIRF